MCNCPCPPKPGYLCEPYHLPGYSGHVATLRDRIGGSYGRLTNDAIQDPCTAQAPCPVLAPPVCPCPPMRSDPPKPKSNQSPMCPRSCDPCDHHLNRSPYVCLCKPEPDVDVYRCCESIPSSYAGHVPGFTFKSNGTTFGNATWGTKQYMDNCWYCNTFLH